MNLTLFQLSSITILFSLHGILEDLVGAPAPKPGQVLFPPFVIIIAAWTVAIGLVVLAISGARAVRGAAGAVAVGAAAA